MNESPYSYNMDRPRRSRRPTSYQGRHVRPQYAGAILRALGILLAIALVVYLLAAPHLFNVERTKITVSSMASGTPDIRVVFVSDIHRGSFPFTTADDVKRLVSSINAQKPDIVILGGDYAADPDSAAAFFRELPTIRASYGVYAIAGDTDREEGNFQRLCSAMLSANVNPLLDEKVTLRIGNQNVILVGADDVATVGSLNNVSKLASGCKSDDLVIFACHDPQYVDETLALLTADGHKGFYDLGLFGHTHGGQMPVLNLLGMYTSATYREGWYSPNRSSSVLVSRGIGMEKLPLRLLTPPTIHVITLGRN